MPPKARPAKSAKPANKMDPAAAAATLVIPTAGPSSRSISATVVPSKSTRTLFAEDDTEFLTLLAKLAAFRIEQAAGGKHDNGKGKDADFKDAVSDAEEDHSAEEEDGVSSGAAQRTCFLDYEDDGLMAHDPKECFEEKAKEELAAKLCFPLTLLIPSDHLQEVTSMWWRIRSWINPRWGGPAGENDRLMHLFGGLLMSDALCALNPGAREYTFYARPMKSSSQINRILVSAELLPAVVEASHIRSLRGISDHKCVVKVVLEANLRLHMGPGIWRLTSTDTAKPGVEKVIKAVTKKHHEKGSRNFGSLLITLKAPLRRYATEERKRELATLRHLELAVSGLQQELLREPHRDDLRCSSTDMLKGDFMGFVNQLEASAVLPKEVQEAVTILLYKKGPMEQIQNYRPITLMTSSYKVVAKLLANRMKKVLSTVISKEQQGFLPGKQQIGREQGLLEEFGARSGLRVNKEKSALLPLGKNLKKEKDVESGFAWVEPNDAERLLGIWVSPSGSAEVTWDKTLARAAEELTKWTSRHLTTTARVAEINAYVCPILAFQGQILPNGKKPVGRQKAVKGLELIKLGGFVGLANDGVRFFKDEKMLEKELGTLEKARKALKIFSSVLDS
ncbi:unnamed protein product [Closterium sp. NIES-65]|nr:unnamed protein product [Closterium sp. NIES-65]